MVLAAGFHDGFLSRAMPHLGHAPGLSDSTPGHMGQKYLAPTDGSAAEPWALWSWSCLCWQQEGVTGWGLGLAAQQEGCEASVGAGTFVFMAVLLSMLMVEPTGSSSCAHA